MDNILTQIFNLPSNNSTIPSEEASHESFLPHLQFIECMPCITTFSLFSWNYIPELYCQGFWRLLMLKSSANGSHITDETAVQLLNLTNEGVDLQILDMMTEGGGDFLENFRKEVCSH